MDYHTIISYSTDSQEIPATYIKIRKGIGCTCMGLGCKNTCRY